MRRAIRTMMLPVIAALLLTGCAKNQSAPTATSQSSAKAHAAPVTPADQALARLVEGNQRFQRMQSRHPNLSHARLAETSKGQRPFAIILGCADSRIPAELVFDTGIGDLFVVRVAGNITDDAILGSIEYAVEHLGANLILVLGHEKCGAVAAAVDAAGKDAHAPGHIGSLIKPIEPVVADAKKAPGDALDNAVRANVRHVVRQISAADPILSKAVKSGHLKVVGARYDLDTGAVELLD